jgi:hypothetical protein
LLNTVAPYLVKTLLSRNRVKYAKERLRRLCRAMVRQNAEHLKDSKELNHCSMPLAQSP